MIIPIPVGDVNPRKTFPVFNYLLILANIAVFCAYWFRPADQIVEVVNTYALVPRSWTPKTILTSMFLHGDPFHLLGNMLFLWIAGDNVEDRLGHLGYLIFYLAAGAAGAAAHILTAHGDMATIPTVGASGAISGVLGAYLIFFPASQIKFLLLIFFVIPRRILIPSWAWIGFWVGTQIYMARDQFRGLAKGESALVAVFAHLGGFIFGFALAVLARMLSKRPEPKRAS